MPSNFSKAEYIREGFKLTGREMTGIIYDYSGVVHVHSTLSDGFGPVEKIIRAANQTGCAYLVLTDHNTLAAREKGWEGWHKNKIGRAHV